jgi:hypothetical protein
MSAPVTLYSPDGKRSREIAAIDAPGWIKSGWSATPVSIQPVIASVAQTELQEELIPATPPVPQATKSKRNDVPRDGVPES